MAKEDNWAEEYYSDQATIKKLEAEIRHQEDVVRYESDNRKTGQKALQAETKIKQLKEQIRKLKSKWKWMKDMAITKDTAEILKLSGFTVDEKSCEEKIFTKGTEDSLIGSQVFARIQGEVRKVLVLREENGRLYVKDPISGTQGWIKSEQVRDKKDSPKEELIKYAEKTKDPEYIAHVKGLKNQNTINARLQAHRQGKDGDIILPQHKCSDELLGSAKESMSQSEIDKSSWRTLNYIINHPNKFTPKTVLMAEKAIKKFEKAFTGDDDATKGGAIHQYGKGTLTRDYNFEEPKVIEEAIRKIKASGHPDPHYLAGLERALYLAKKERGIKDNKDSDPKVTEAETIINLCGGVK